MIRGAYRRLMQLLCIRRNVRYPRDLHIARNSLLMAPDCLDIGHNVSVGMNTWIACNGSIGHGVLISSYVGIVGKADHDMHAIGLAMTQAPWIYDADVESRSPVHEIHIDDDVWIGFGARLLSGIRIGRGAVIAAGAVVVKDVPPYAIMAGLPAKQVGQRFTEDEIKQHEAILYDGPAPVNKPYRKGELALRQRALKDKKPWDGWK